MMSSQQIIVTLSTLFAFPPQAFDVITASEARLVQ